MNKVLICGGRDYRNEAVLRYSLDTAHRQNPILSIIEGGAKGADTLGREWAILNNIPFETFEAEWDVHGRSAGHIRNNKMLTLGAPDSVIAFPGGRGTENMISISEKKGTPVYAHPFGIDPKDYVFDIETTPNFFSCVFRHRASRTRWIFEVSDWCNNAVDFIHFLNALSAFDCRLIGFNNFYFDWQVCEHILSIGTGFTAADAFRKTDQLINGDREANFKTTVWGQNQKVKQIDLYLIHHFDNFAKSTSLKETEFNMRSRDIGDLPFTPGESISENMRNTVIKYNCDDVDETEKFTEFSKPMIDFREELIPTMGYDVMNYNDTKIGKKFFEQELRSRAPHLLGTGNTKRQTPRKFIKLVDVILPMIEFETPQLQGILEYLKNTTLTQTKAPPELKDLTVTLEGFTMHVGAGGGHGSVERQCVRPEPGWKLLDVDVASYYPNIAIVNKFFPAHLSETFCDIYENVYLRRKKTKKKTAPNEMLKLALNGVYGDSANPHSIFLDPQYTMQVTINGQLLLYLLTEKMLCHTNARMIQLNTDGITFLIPETEESMVRQICDWWQNLTNLELEFAEYEAMWIRDVNNYIAKSTGGYMKRIGAYAFETQRENPATREVKWSKDHSALVVQKAASAEMVDGISAREFIYSHADVFDFMLRSKATGKTRQRIFNEGDVDSPPRMEVGADGSPVFHVDKKGKQIHHSTFKPDAGKWLQKMTRYYMAKNGGYLQMIHQPAPAARERQKERIIGKHVGWKVAACDDIMDFDPTNLDYEWYITEAEKLVIR